MKCDLWGSVPTGFMDFRGPVPTGIFVGLSPQDFQGSVPAVDYESSRGRDNHVMIM